MTKELRSAVLWISLALTVLIGSTGCLAATLNVHWCPNVRQGSSTGTQHGGASGNIWVNMVQANDNDPNTIESLTYVSGYYQENAHGAPQYPLPWSGLVTSATCPSCAAPNQMVASMDPTLIWMPDHNASYTISMTCRYTKMTMFPLGSTSSLITLTTAINRDNCVITQAPDYVIKWDPTTMTGIDLPCTWTDAQLNTANVTYTIGSVAKTVGNLDSPGNNTHTTGTARIRADSSPYRGVCIAQESVSRPTHPPQAATATDLLISRSVTVQPYS